MRFARTVIAAGFASQAGADQKRNFHTATVRNKMSPSEERPPVAEKTFRPARSARSLPGGDDAGEHACLPDSLDFSGLSLNRKGYPPAPCPVPSVRLSLQSSRPAVQNVRPFQHIFRLRPVHNNDIADTAVENLKHFRPAQPSLLLQPFKTGGISQAPKSIRAHTF